MRYRIMETEQRKKPGSVLKQNTQGTTLVQNSASSQLQTDLMAAQAGLGNRYVQRVVDRLKAEQDDSELKQPAQPDLKDSERENRTGLPDQLKLGVEQLSGYSLEDVRVHYNSPKPAELQALAYTQGTVIHVAPGQERHLSHEAWHVVQQMQGRVKPNIQVKEDISISNDYELEHDANVMGRLADQEWIVNELTHDEERQNRMITMQSALSQERLTYRPGSVAIIQRAINSTLVDSFKARLNLNNVTIVEVPNNPSITLDTKFMDYPPCNTYNLGAIGANSLLDINFGSKATPMRSDPSSQELLSMSAFDIVDSMGGGGYVHTVNMVMYNEGTSNVERAILHEMGHAKQNEQLGANFETANRIILEYHNILLHENTFVDMPQGQRETKRTRYMNARKTAKSRGKTWDEFVQHATEGKNPFSTMNRTLINEIIDILGRPGALGGRYVGISDEIKTNLVIEYFNTM